MKRTSRKGVRCPFKKKSFLIYRFSTVTALEDLISHEELPPVDLKKLNSIEAWNTLNLRYKKAVGIDVVSTNIDAPVIILPSYQPLSDPNDSEFLMPHPRL